MKKLLLDEKDEQNLLALFDAAIRHGGLQAASVATELIKKITEVEE